MKLKDMETNMALRIRYKMLTQLCARLENNQPTVILYVDGQEVTNSGPDRDVRDIALTVFLEKRERVKAQLILIGVDDFSGE